MANSVLSAPHFKDETAAFEYVESRLWPDGPTCPHCGNADAARIGRLQGKTTRPGLRKCYECGKPFTVRQGTIFESSHLALRLWLQVIHLMCASKKGIATRQIQRMLNCSMKTAWFLGHRIREAMADNNGGQIGGDGKSVEADETYFGTKDEYRGKSHAEKKGHSKKMGVVSLVSGGKARTFHVDRADKDTIRRILLENVKRESTLHTDESPVYSAVGREFRSHETVNHTVDEYVSKTGATTNRVENYFSVFKRGMKGVYQQCSEKHLQRYLAEFDFRFNNREALGVNDVSRAENALVATKGKRLTYATTSGTQAKA